MKKKNKHKVFVLNEEATHLVIPVKILFPFLFEGRQILFKMETHLPIFINTFSDTITILN